MTIAQATVRRLTKEAVRLNETLGDPTSAAKPPAKRAGAGRDTRSRVGKRAI
jgi:hypothetical protein